MQDAPRDVSPEYLATQATTQQVLQALQKAWLAKQRILSGGQPVAHHQSEVMTMQTPLPAELGHQHTACIRAEISSCGAYLAVCMRLEQPFDYSGSTHKLKLWTPFTRLFEVVVYTIPRFQVQACIPCGFAFKLDTRWHDSRDLGLDICWAPHMPCLSVAMPFTGCCQADQLDVLDVSKAGFHAALVVDASSGATLCALSLTTVASLHKCFWDNLKDAEGSGAATCVSWSPSGHKLLVCWDSDDQLNPARQSKIGIYDVWQDQLVVETQFSFTLPLGRPSCPENWAPLPASWHPESSGIALSGGMTLPDPGAFETVDIALGRLPEGWVVGLAPGMGFTSDATCFVAHRHRRSEGGVGHDGPSTDDYDKLPVTRHCLFHCSIQGNQISLVPQHEIRCREFHIVPQSHKYMVNFGYCSAEAALIMDCQPCSAHSADPTVEIAGSLYNPLEFSPSGHLLGDIDCLPRVLSINGTADFVWELSSNARTKEQLRRQHFRMGSWCIGWSPCGRGLLYMGKSSSPLWPNNIDLDDCVVHMFMFHRAGLEAQHLLCNAHHSYGARARHGPL